MENKSAFIIDDEVFIALDIEAYMLDLGFDVIGPALTMNEGFQAIADYGDVPNIALMDINIGGDLVWPLAEHLMSMGSKIVFVSANNNHAELETTFQNCPVIDKPASFEKIAETISCLD